MITEIFKTREEVLQEAINYYWGKPERKCVDVEGNCVYHPTETSEGCAIGRYIDPEIAFGLPLAGVDNKDVLKVLPEWLKDMGIIFLILLQICHDSDVFVKADLVRLQSIFGRRIDFNLITFPD